MENSEIKDMILRIIKNYGTSLQVGDELLRRIETEYKERNNLQHFENIPVDIQEKILTEFYDLFCNGLVSLGKDLNNPYYPWFHLTQVGKKALENIE